MTISEITAVFTGLNGLPGTSRFYVDDTVQDGPTAAPHIQQWFEDNKGYFPASLTVAVQSSGNIFNPTTGALAGTWALSPTPTPTVGSGANAAAGGVGACMRWVTGAISPGNRFIVGRTFLIPLATGAYASDGTLTSFCVADLIAHATTLISATGGALGVWTRPKPPAAGAFHPILLGTVADQAARLRSRRR